MSFFVQAWVLDMVRQGALNRSLRGQTAQAVWCLFQEPARSATA